MNLKLNNGMKMMHTETINGIRYTTVSIFNGEMDLNEKIGKMITESFNATAMDDLIIEDQIPTEKAG